MSIKFARTLSAAAAFSACLLAANPAEAQLQVLPGETAFQQQVLAAIAKMCAIAFSPTYAPAQTAMQVDLHDQCHAIARADIEGTGSAQTTIGAIAQVSGNEISAQGALSNRVVSGQFANISGRLDALRFGANAAIASGRVAATGAGFGDNAYASSTGPRSFYVDNTMLDSGSDGFAPSFAPPLGSPLQGTLTNVALVSAERPLVAATDSSGGGSSDAARSAVSTPWGVFVQGSYSSGHHDLTTNEDPFDFHASSVTAGVDYNFGPAVLGGSLGYDDYDAGFTPTGTLVAGGGTRVEGTSGSIYGAWFGEHWTFNGIASYGFLRSSENRLVHYTIDYIAGANPQTLDPTCITGQSCTVGANATFHGNPDGHSIAVGATAGYQLTVANWDIMPSLSANYRRTSFSSFSEYTTGPMTPGDGLALAYGDQVLDSLRAILGVEVSRPFSVSFGVISPIVRAEWDHEFKTDVTYIQAHYAYDPSLANGQCLSCFAIPADASPSNYGIAGAGLSVTLAQRIQAFVYDEVLFGFADYRSNSVAFGVRAQL